MATKSKHSIEEKIEDWCKKQFKGQKYYTKTETINSEIDFALEKAPSKQGGSGMNYPDIKYLLTSDNSRRIPVMIEVKGKKRDLIKVNEKGEIDNPKKNSDSNVLTDGPISRINFCTIPERKIGAEMPVYGEFDDDAEKLGEPP